MMPAFRKAFEYLGDNANDFIEPFTEIDFVKTNVKNFLGNCSKELEQND